MSEEKAVETVEYRGITFRRYPNSDNYSDRHYYRPSGDLIEQGVEALHREIWKDEHGEIPDGHHIHHIDGDSSNNSIDNLKCLTFKEHVECHDWGPDTINDAALEAAKEWHKSADGSEWHKEHWKDSLKKLFENPKTKPCEQCGSEFEYYTSARFCSNACKSAWRRETGVDDEQRICEICRGEFTVNKYSQKSTCSRRCAGAMQSWTKRL